MSASGRLGQPANLVAGSSVGQGRSGRETETSTARSRLTENSSR